MNRTFIFKIPTHSMKQVLLLILLLGITLSAFSQTKKRGKVKRKYRDVEKVAQNLPPVFLQGFVYDWDENPVVGATVTIDGTRKQVNTNEYGEFLIEDLNTGKARIRVSFVGYETKTTDLEIRAGKNYKDIMLRDRGIYLQPNGVSAQKREQQILDVPTAITSVNKTSIGQMNITGMDMLSELVPGFYFWENGANRPNHFIRGISGNEPEPGDESRIAVFANNVPLNRYSLSSAALFDMERIEVMKGPQTTLFGRGAMAGAVHYLSKMPVNNLEGYITAGVGNFNQQEFRTAVNIPVIEDKLFVRASGIYHSRDGYIENTFGGALNGKNTMGGRFAARFIPAWNHKFDVIVNYQQDETPGLAYMSKTFPNTNGESGIFTGVASHEQNDNLGTNRDFFDATLNYRYYISEHSTWTSITSFKKGNSHAKWDGDGTASEAIVMSESDGSTQFYQEITGNFSYKSRLIGALGLSFWWEEAERNFAFSTNEQHFASLMLLDSPTPVNPSGQPIVIPEFDPEPDSVHIPPIPLPTKHQEEIWNKISNQSTQAFMDVTWQVTRKIFVHAGLRGIFDIKKMTYLAEFTGGSPSVLGSITGYAPNLLFKRTTESELRKNYILITGNTGIKYKLNEYGNIFLNYARGYRPIVLQYSETGRGKLLNPEVLHNFEAGLKASFFERVYLDATAFYQIYKDFQTGAWVGSYPNGDPYYLVTDDGKANSYGIESSINISVLKQIQLFGNYSYLQTAFDSLNTANVVQQFSGNRFAYAPEHSFTAGINLQFDITSDILFFLTPSYAYKSQLWFTGSNSIGLGQEAYGLLNINGGIKFARPRLDLSVFGTNLLNENYALSGGNTGNQFGIPTFVPGPPTMFGTKLTWNF
jgi:outer membrane receptor protein involved in Fe transport